MTAEPNFLPASATKRHLSGLADASIFMALVTIAFVYNSELMIKCLFNPILTALILIPCLGIFRFCTFTAFNGTPGMLLFQIKLLNHDLNAVPTKYKLMASFFILHSDMDYYSKN